MAPSISLWSICIAILASGCSSSSTSSSPSKGAAKAPASLDGGTPAGKAVKGGTGSTAPATGRGKAGSATTGSSAKKPVASDGGDNPCTGVTDGQAVCGSATDLYFCAGQQLYTVDCNAFAQAAG